MHACLRVCVRSLSFEWIAVAHCRAHSKARQTPNRQTANEKEARDSSRSLNVIDATPELRVMRDGRRGHHAHAGDVAVRRAEEQEEEHEEYVGAGKGRGRVGRGGGAVDVAHEEEGDEERAEEGEDQQTARGPDVQTRERAQKAAAEVACVED